MKSEILSFTFCDNYIQKLTNYLMKHYAFSGKDFRRIAIIFGGKRPSLFLKKQLADHIKDNFYPPKFFTIDEFMSNVTARHDFFSETVDLDNSYLLYHLAKETTADLLKGRESFSEFLPWAQEIIRFIDQLDLENIDNNKLLAIKSNAEIGYDVPDDINQLLKKVVVLREQYHKKLLNQKSYSRGLQYLRAAQLIAQTPFDEFDQILFCNFFYFNRTEEKVALDLYKRNKATFLFQGDQRRWPVLERISKRFACQITEGPTVRLPKFNLKLYKGFDAHSQVALTREVLKGINNLDQTVIVLPNAQQIVPLISEITTLVKDFNISMGYPLKRSSLHTLFEFVFQTQLSRKHDQYYMRDYLKVLRHPFVKNLKLAQDAAQTRTLIHKIEEILTGKERASISGSLFLALDEIENLDELYLMTAETLNRMGQKITQEELKQMLKTIHTSVFRQWEKVDTFGLFSLSMERFLDFFLQFSPIVNYPLNINIAGKVQTINDEFKVSTFRDEKFKQEDIFKIFDHKVSREIIAFVGSPLKDLQLLGLFETRSLNFENVIILDVNEGVLPKLNLYEPFIPREVMISLNLDRLELEEEIQRYQFMRLISSAKNVHLIYQESKEKERSRFIEELIWEEEKKSEKTNVVAIEQGAFNVSIQAKSVVVPKTPQMIEVLKKHTYSASSINMYLRNPMDFYYNYVLGLREEEDLLDEPDARHIGTFIHGLLEESFRPFLGKQVTIDAQFRKHFADLFELRFLEVFQKSMKSDAFLMKTVIAERLNRFLDHEQVHRSKEIEKVLFLENRFEETISLNCGPIKFGYVVDRIDQLKNGTVLIIDYKTGSQDLIPKMMDYRASAELSREMIFENVKSFQLPLYYHYLSQRFSGHKVNAALYNLRTVQVHSFVNDKVTMSTEEINQNFKFALDFILCEILDISTPFSSVSNV